ncbi:replicative DNA helicase [Methylobacillus sp. Pita2]|uniref:replicative DNA helicase n=1 Tax=Methylobacillus sp. Pita2 TaxID=3383245 RepID=UPI0038B623A0
MLDTTKVLHNEEAEQALLALTLKSSRDFIDLCQESDFFNDDHRTIWRVIKELDEKALAIDPITVNNMVLQYSNRDLLDYLSSLYGMEVPEESGETYALAIRQHAYSRRTIEAARKMEKVASSAVNVEAKASAIAAIMDEVERSIPIQYEAMSLYDAIRIKGVEMEQMNSGDIKPIFTGLDDLDALTNGFLPGELIVIAGRPGMGKTTLAVNIAEHNAINNDIPSLIFSLEMRSSELGGRTAGSMAGIDGKKLRTGDLSEYEWDQYSAAMNRSAGMNIHIDDRPALAIEEMRVAAKRHARKHGLGLIVVDYLQIATTVKSVSGRYEMITEISGAMKRMAKELSVPVIALSQLSRDLEKRADKRPIPADLRESGAIEQDADCILFVYRDDIYHKDSPMPGIAELIVAKQRSGSLGVANAKFDGEHSRFKNAGYGGDPYYADYVEVQ